MVILQLAACGHDSSLSSFFGQQSPVGEVAEAERQNQRRLPIAGAANFRDLGGYTTTDGKRTKWGMLYRSDALNALTDEDQKYLQQLNIIRIADFRAPDEAAEAPDKLPQSLAERYVSMPIAFNDGNYAEFARRIMRGDTKGLQLDHLLIEANTKFVNESSPIFRAWLHGLLDQDTGTQNTSTQKTGAQIFHCTGGKDRTDMAAAIFLLTLGVPHETVMQDYMLSNDYLRSKNEIALWKMRIFSLGRADTDGVRHLIQTEPRYLQTAFDEMRKQYGSIDNYLRDALGVDDVFRAQLRAKYLEL